MKKISRALAYAYPYEREGAYKAKYSVSEIKHQAMEEAFSQEPAGQPLFLEDDDEPCVPVFIASKDASLGPRGQEHVSAGALRGTAVHRLLECFDFRAASLTDSLEEQIGAMLADGRLTKEQEQLISRRKLRVFLTDPIAERMAAAAAQGKLYREKAFVMGDTPGNLFDEKSDSGEMVLIQGIIVVFFDV